MSEFPTYTAGTSPAEVSLELQKAGYGSCFSITRSDMAALLHRAATRSVENLNAVLKDEIIAERARIFTALRGLPGCLISDEQLRKVVGVES